MALAGVGKVSAANLIWEYGGIPGIVENAAVIPGAVGIRIRSGLDNIALDRKLTGIVTDMDLGVTMEDLRVQPTDTVKLDALYRQLNFNSLL